SSRRRHTRCLSDWSSDVCSSDLYRLSPGARLINSLFRLLTRLGLGAAYRHVLTVPGCKTGRLYSTPVDIIEHDDRRWLVAGYGRSEERRVGKECRGGVTAGDRRQ